MKLRTLGRALLRRWYALVAGLVAVGGLCYFLYGAVPVDYKTTGSVVLLPSAESVGNGGNPYLFLTGLGQAMDVLSRRLSAPDVTERLTKDHPSASYTAVSDVTSGSSILVVTVKSRSSADASATMAGILDDVPTELKAMQDDLKVPPTARISSMQVAQPTAPIVDSKPRLQATAAAGAAGLLLVILLTAFIDGLMLRRSRRREPADVPDAESHEAEARGEERSPMLVPVPAVELGDLGDMDEAVEAERPRRQRRVSHDRG